MPSYAEIYPAQNAPVLRKVENTLMLDEMAWGLPGWKEGMRPITNVRNLTSSFWKNMLCKPDNRCFVPVTQFCEWTGEKGSKRKVWFSLADTPVFCFAGIWRDTNEGPRYAFLTCDPNEIVAPIHPKAMPVILEPNDYDQWLCGDYHEATVLAEPYSADEMKMEEEQ